ncbi:MAG: pyridoxamine 5'-phosphate oxidase [Pseudomonadales bacterium]|jgi:pyridoxamine 5'-phosphate oxidase|nr:pyridoxamine 5'-phosphate oxidase [Pseudomonadales bacterium]
MDDAEDPIELFREWFALASEREPDVPDAFALATASADGAPAVRMLLLKGFDASGFRFFTNLESRKGGDLAANPVAAMCFHWKSLARQVRIEGPVEPIPAEEADAYFASRDLGSRIGAWASLQSRPLPDRSVLETRVAEFTERFRDGEVPRPGHWSGFRLVPSRIEFWLDQPSRLHDRLEYLRDGERWTSQRLYP